jgi:hypothetical protein
LEELLEHLIAEREEDDSDSDDEDEHDDDDAVIEERGAYASGPSRRDMEANFGEGGRPSSLDNCSYDFSARVEHFRSQGNDPKKSHVLALQEFARSQYEGHNL